MQYLVIFLSVLVVLLGMNGFIFLTLRQMSRQIRESIRGRLLRELSVFDELYEEKEKRLNELQKKQALLESNIFPREPVSRRAEVRAVTAVTSGGTIPVSQTVNPDFYEEYRYVRQAFAFDYEPLIGQVMAAEPAPDRNRGESAEAFLAAVSEETALELSTLAGAEQLQVLEQALPPEITERIHEYLEQEGVSEPDFSVLELISYSKMISRLYRDTVTVYTGTSRPPALRSDVRVVYDPSICEGIRIVRGNRLYDYSF